MCARILGPAPVFAGDNQGVVLQVRVIKGSLPTQAGSARKFEYDKRLEDLRPELTRLRYASFSLVTAQRKVVRLAHRETIQLGDGETLTVRPHYLDPEKVGMWLRWVEKSGAPVLDTRLHMNPGRSILLEESRLESCHDKAETDQAAQTDAGMILAISVAPVEPEN